MLTILLTINALLVFLLIYRYESKIKKLQKELVKTLAERTVNYVKKVDIPLRELRFKLDYRGHLKEPIEESISDFSKRASEYVWHCYKDYLRESIYCKVYDFLVTDARTRKDNFIEGCQIMRDFNIEVMVRYILPDLNNVEINKGK